MSALGVAIAAGTGRPDRVIRRLQNELFDLGAGLASPDEDAPTRITGAHVAGLEVLCDEVNTTLLPPKSFVLPGTGAASAALHHARAICRRAERHAWATAGTGDDARRYLDRLSDVLFVLARAAASGEGAHLGGRGTLVRALSGVRALHGTAVGGSWPWPSGSHR